MHRIALETDVFTKYIQTSDVYVDKTVKWNIALNRYKAGIMTIPSAKAQLSIISKNLS